MMSFSTKSILLSTLLTLTLSACGGQIPVLPDDPLNEPSHVGGEVELPSVEPETPVTPPVVPTEREKILSLYDYLDPQRVVPTRHLEEAVIYFHKNKSAFKNDSTISIIDYSKRSTEKRWYFVNMKTGAVWNIHASHGKGSDSTHDGYAKTFSNVSGSNATSLGFYKTAEAYTGSNGYSLRLDGLSSTNSNARARAIVVHGADYVQDAAVIQGRSWGCPAVSQANRDKVINLIKGGSLIYAAK